MQCVDRSLEVVGVVLGGSWFLLGGCAWGIGGAGLGHRAGRAHSFVLFLGGGIGLGGSANRVHKKC